MRALFVSPSERSGLDAELVRLYHGDCRSLEEPPPQVIPFVGEGSPAHDWLSYPAHDWLSYRDWLLYNEMVRPSLVMPRCDVFVGQELYHRIARAEPVLRGLVPVRVIGFQERNSPGGTSEAVLSRLQHQIHDFFDRYLEFCTVRKTDVAMYRLADTEYGKTGTVIQVDVAPGLGCSRPGRTFSLDDLQENGLDVTEAVLFREDLGAIVEPATKNDGLFARWITIERGDRKIVIDR